LAEQTDGGIEKEVSAKGQVQPLGMISRELVSREQAFLFSK